MFINLLHSPWSRAGSFLRLSLRNRSDTWRVMTSSARGVPYFDLATDHSPKEYHELALYAGDVEVRYEASATPWELTLTSEAGDRAQVLFADDDTLLFSVPGHLRLCLLPVRSTNVVHPRGSSGFSILDFRGLCHQQVRPGSNARVSVEVGTTVDGKTGPYSDKPHVVRFEALAADTGEAYSAAFRISRHGELWQGPLPAHEPTRAARRQEWQAWQARRPKALAALAAAADEAWYVLWSCRVPAEGLYKRPAILMSMNWMDRVWSWDNCFNALGVASADPELAFDQVRLLLDHQAPIGSLPDCIDDLVSRHTFVKPPVYGWTVLQLLGSLGTDVCRGFLQEIYEPLIRLTEWWLTYRDSDGDGICDYLHGNDCGWDNCTAFDHGYPTEGADLGAHLVLSMEAIGRIGRILGRRQAADHWHERSRAHLARLLEHSLVGGRFVSPLSGAHSASDTGCLLNYVPLELGARLPEPVRRTLVEDLRPGGPYLTEHGLATQRPDSPQYRPTGYWRGPIWAPSTHLIWSGLNDAGETDLATTIAARFCRMCAAAPGMWENYEATTGRGLCCPAYSWTAASFLVMSQALHDQEPDA